MSGQYVGYNNQSKLITFPTNHIGNNNCTSTNLNTILLDMRLTNLLVKINNESLLSFQQVTYFEQITNRNWSIEQIYW